MDNILEKIREFADHAHGDQIRKYTGERYIGHPIRVMEICSEYTRNRLILATALLHDVLEDTKVNKLQMSEFLVTLMDQEDAATVLKLVSALTDVYTKEDYPLLNRKRRRFKESERLQDIPGDAQTVKYADIIDNTIDITHNDPDFATVYLRECMNILQKMTKGDPELYKRALQTVKGNMQKLNI